ncbi:MAG: DEAD/DEAH box helicase, partial [Lapillicoccus sp.]
DLHLTRLDPPLDRNQARFLALGTVRIPSEDVDRFLTTHAPGLSRQVSLVSSDGSVEFPEVQRPTLGLVVTHERSHRVVLRWHFRYAVGERVVTVLPDKGGTGGVPRDTAAETTLLAGPAAVIGVPGLRITVGGQPRLVPVARLSGLAMLAFLDDVLPDLLTDPDVDVTVEGEPLDYEEADEAPLVRLTVTDPGKPSTTGGTDWFDLGVNVTVGGETVPLATLLTALTHGEGHVILDSGTWFRTDQPELQELRRILDEARAIQDDPEAPIRLTPYQADLWAELVGLGVVDEQSERWAASVAALGGRDGLPVPTVPEGLNATLRPYQVEGFQWLTLLRRAGLGGILADDMGLGKTIQALAMTLDARADDPTGPPVLVVAPTSVLTTWAGEVARFCPQLRVVTLGATSRKRGTTVVEAVAGADLVLTSYAVFRLDAVGFREAAWSTLVLDEAQFAKNHQSLVHQCARRLPARVKLAITGTPMENNLMELWSLLSIVAPGLFPSPQRFSEVYRRPIENGSAPERLEILRSRIRPVVLRRTKEAVATDLPPKQEQTLEVTLSPKHRRIYDTHLQRERQKLLGLLEDAEHNRIAIFRSLTRLRQLSLDPALIDAEHEDVGSAKLDTLLEMLDPIIAEGHRVLVFSQFTSFLARLRRRLDDAGIAHAYLDGSTRDRAGAIGGFRDGDAPVFLISLKAGGFGLNLTEADYVFLLDPWWNPAAEAQAIDRTHRIGQDKHVMVYRLVSADTIEEKVVALQARKRELFGQVIDGGAMHGGAITTDDIRGLLLPD